MIYFVVFSLSHSFGKNSSWIVFLEEETHVKMTKLVQVLAQFNKNEVSVQYSLKLQLSLSVFAALSLCAKLISESKASSELQL